MKSLAALLLAVLLLGACGLKGPLYLPPPEADPGPGKTSPERKK